MSTPNARMARIHCSFCAEVILVPLAFIIMDVIEQVYRAPCAQCGTLLEKDLNYQLEQVLRNQGIKDVQEHVQDFATALDSDEQGFWHYVHDVPYRNTQAKQDTDQE